MAKKETNRDRRAKVAAMQAQQKAAERRRLWTVIGAIAVVVLLVAGAVTWAVLGEQQKEQAALGSLAADAQAASCDPVTTDEAEDSGRHIGPGTDQPNVTKAEYSTVPPSSGAHLAAPALDDRRVYTTADAPPMEALVHNLEHGYTILWYDRSVEQEKASAFEALAKKVNDLPESAGKFVISPWDPEYGALPEGKKYALSHWSADVDMQTREISNARGNRQLCGELSASVVEDFVKAHPWSSAPEPGAA